MSMDLMAWKAPRTTDEDEAKALVDRYGAALERGDAAVFEPSDDVLRFYDELLARYPPLEGYDDDKQRDVAAPWAMTPERSDRFIEMSVRWSAPAEALDFIVELARKHDLVLYDPQGPVVHWPEGPPGPPSDPRGEIGRALGIGLIGVLLVVAGWLVPYRILSWPMMGIGLFVVVVIVYISVGLWKAEPDQT